MKMWTRFTAVIACGAWVLIASGVGSPLTGQGFSSPVLGYQFDQSHGAMRLIVGIPGAALVGGILDVGVNLSGLAMASSQTFALGKAEESSEVLLLDLTQDPVSVRPVVDAAPAPDQMVLSPAGRAAALYYHDEGRIRILRDLPRTAAVHAELQLDWRTSSVVTIGISDEGVVLVSVKESDGESIFALTERGTRFLFKMGHASAVTFIKDSNDALVTDFKNNQVLLFRDVAGSGQTFMLAGPQDGVAQPVAIAVSHSSQRALVMNADSGNILFLSLNGDKPLQFSCECRAVGFHLKGDSLFQLISPSETLLVVLDASGEVPRTYLVPNGETLPLQAPTTPLPKTRRIPH